MLTTINGVDCDEFTAQYLETSVWASTVMLPVAPEELIDGCMDVDDEHPLHGLSEDDNLDSRFGIYDFTADALRQACWDCDAFRASHSDDLEDEDDGHAGHNFWLNRNGHGAGFWDGDYEEKKGERLSAGCEAFRELHVWVDEEGALHFE